MSNPWVCPLDPLIKQKDLLIEREIMKFETNGVIDFYFNNRSRSTSSNNFMFDKKLH